MPASPDEGWDYLEERFGVDRSAVQGDLRPRGDDLWLVACDDTGLPVETAGFRCVRGLDIGLKPTTYALQFLGDRITRSRVEVDREELLTLLDGDLLDRAPSEGYVALVFRGRVLGCGLSKGGELSSRIPKARARELRPIVAQA